MKQQAQLNEKHMQDNKREFERSLDGAQEKYGKTITEFSREILKANLEADRLQAKLNAKEGTNVERAIPFSKAEKKTTAMSTNVLMIVLIAVLVSVVWWFGRLRLLSIADFVLLDCVILACSRFRNKLLRLFY